jgi:hypothetical protein
MSEHTRKEQEKKLKHSMYCPFFVPTELSTGGIGDKVSLKAWLKRPEVLGSFPCNEVLANGEHFAG